MPVLQSRFHPLRHHVIGYLITSYYSQTFSVKRDYLIKKIHRNLI